MALDVVSAMPVLRSMGCLVMPSGVMKMPVLGLTDFMKFVQMGAAPLPPVIWALVRLSMSWRRSWRLSKPTQTLVTKLGVKPVNQASVLSLVVPVLPAVGAVNPSARTRRPVPWLTTCCMSLLMV